MSLRIGQTVEIPEVEGKWQVWSKAGDHGPGAYFVVRDGVCRVIRATRRKGVAFPVIKSLDTP